MTAKSYVILKKKKTLSYRYRYSPRGRLYFQFSLKSKNKKFKHYEAIKNQQVHNMATNCLFPDVMGCMMLHLVESEAFER